MIDSTDVHFIYFPVGKSQLNPDFHDNQTTLQRILTTLETLQNEKAQQIDSLHIRIRGLASVEGPSAGNLRLAENRALALKRYIQEATGFPDDRFILERDRKSWHEFRRMVLMDDNFPVDRMEVVNIIDNPNLNEDQKERQLRRLHGGSVLRYLQQDIFPRLRSASMVALYIYKVGDEPVIWRDTRMIFEPAAPMPVVAELPPYAPVHRLTPVKVELPVETVVEMIPEPDTCDFEASVAVKSNLLYDAALAPNIEVERWFGRDMRWSVMGEYWAPWYVWKNNSRAYEIQNFGVELRYWWWSNPKYECRPLTGWFAGIYGAAGKYDLEWDSDGDQGEYWSAGLSVGYTFRIAKRLNLELSAAAGVINGPQRHYKGMYDDTHLIWQYNKHLNYIGPTKLKLSLVWLLPPLKKGKEARR